MTLLANVATTDIFLTWINRTNQLLTLSNLFTDGVANANTIRSNTQTIASWALVGGINVGPTLTASFAQANTANTQAYITVQRVGDTMTGNLVFSNSNIEFAAGNTGIFWNAFTYISEPAANTLVIVTTGTERLRIDPSGIITACSSLTISNMNVYPTVVAAFAAANTAGSSGIAAAFVRANNSWGNIFVTGTDSTYNWANVAPGNIGITATNSANTVKIINGGGLEIDVDTGNNAVRFLTGAFSAANTAATNAATAQAVGVAAFAQANTAALEGLGAFVLANTHTTNITAAFAKANTADTDAVAAFAKANTAIITNTSDRLSSLGVGTAASGTTGEIRATNEITAFFSDMRLKDKIATIANALEKIRTLEGFTYKANDIAVKAGFSSGRVEVGLSAQAVQKIAPEIIRNAPFDSYYDGHGELVSISGENYLTVHYDKIIPYLVEAIKELANIVEDLQEQIDDLQD